MQHKVVTLEGSEVTFAGRAGDPYFDDLGHHDNAMLVDALRLLPSDAMILDVGANIGFTTAVMTKRLPNARIFSFEPDSEPFGYLRETVRLNNLSKVETINKALAAAPGRMAFHCHPRGAGASHLAGDQSLRDGNQTVEVSTVDIERASRALARVDLIKIDVEGFEIDVLEGARDTIAADRPYVADRVQQLHDDRVPQPQPTHTVGKAHSRISLCLSPEGRGAGAPFNSCRAIQVSPRQSDRPRVRR